eukprot:4352981-Prymnesium_polylepis.1
MPPSSDSSSYVSTSAGLGMRCSRMSMFVRPQSPSLTLASPPRVSRELASTAFATAFFDGLYRPLKSDGDE